MECEKRKEVFVLFSVLLFCLLVSSSSSSSAAAASSATSSAKVSETEDGASSRSKRDSNHDNDVVPSHDSLKDLAAGKPDQRRLSESGLETESGFGQLLHERTPTTTADVSRGGKQKRLRDFVGKRDPAHNAEAVSEKRGHPVLAFRDVKSRDSPVTKRSVDKRLRDFVGKRGGYDKRLRDFVGKRDADDGELSYAKRLRDFVGKRAGLDYPEGVQKRLRDFVGKRDGPYDVQKRLRDFVGKRDGGGSYPFHVQRRLRDFVGKRETGPYSFTAQKRLRDFVGKRGFPPSEMHKRLRDFVGKRQALAYSADVQKRLRDFVGKRDAALYSSYLQKRLREFVGKRAQDSAFPLDSPADLGGYLDWRDAGELLDDAYLPIDGESAPRDLAGQSLPKRAPIREFVGKRGGVLFMPSLTGIPVPAEEEDLDLIDDDLTDVGATAGADGDEERPGMGEEDLAMDVSKRLRDFVGKRSAGVVDKRLRDFVGKRNGLMSGQFSEQASAGEGSSSSSSSSDAMAFPLSKRLRDFVGK